MTAWIENRVEVLLVDAVEAHRLGELRVRFSVCLEAGCQFRLEHRLVTLWIKRRLAAFWRSERDLGARILEDIIGSGQLLEPEAGLAAGVAERIVRSQYHENFHRLIL
ncbi:hypothetical protein D3C80_1740790 [compost metagenome]